MTRDQFLAEMMGKCWHEADYMKDGKWDSACQHFYVLCRKCKLQLYSPDKTVYNANYSLNPADILALQQWVMAQEWWYAFYRKMYYDHSGDNDRFGDFPRWLFSNPDRFADLVAQYRRWKDE